MSPRGALRALVAALLIGLIAVLGAGAASAHAQLMRVDPADGTELDTAPDRVLMHFNENISPEFATMNLVGPDCRMWQTGDPVVDGRDVWIAVDELGPAGEYSVAARVISADGHPITPVTRFTVTTDGSGEPGEAVDGCLPGDAESVSLAQEGDEKSYTAIIVWSIVGVVGALVVLALVWMLVRTDPDNDGTD